MNRKSRPVTAREYKVMLRAAKFDGNREDVLNAAESFRIAFADAIRSVATSQDELLVGDAFELRSKEKQATVQFFDTKDRRLANANFVFRRRQPVASETIELTLKRRHFDRFLVSGSQTGRKTTFEEDLKATQTHGFISLYSLSGRVAGVAADTEFQTLKDIQRVFRPLKKQLGDAYDGKAKLLRVCDFTAVQTVLEGAVFPISDQCSAKCALIIWYRESGSMDSAAAVEFSFRHQDKGLGSKQEPFTAEMAKRNLAIFERLCDENSPTSSWVDLSSPTKTNYAYSYARSWRTRRII